MESSGRDQHGNVAGQRKLFHGTAGRDNQPRRRQDADQTVFRIYKGVKTFDFSREKNVIVTGGKRKLFTCRSAKNFCPVLAYLRVSRLTTRTTRIV